MHWAKLKGYVRAARQTGYWCAYDAIDGGMPNFDDCPIRVRIGIFPPDNRKRDDDNIIGGLKHYQDGIFDFINVDDKWIKRRTVVTHPPCKPGKVYYILYQII
jgi:hypothetical protein